MIQRSLLVVIPHQYLVKLFTSDCGAKGKYRPTQSLEPSNEFTPPASLPHVVVIETDVELFPSISQSSDNLYAPKCSSVENVDEDFISECPENGYTAHTETMRSMTMTEEPDVNVPVFYGDIVENGLLVNVRTEEDTENPGVCTLALQPDFNQKELVVNDPIGENVEHCDVNTHDWCDETVQTGFAFGPPENVERSDVNLHALHEETVQIGYLLNSPPEENVERSDVNLHALHEETVQIGYLLNSPPEENVERSDVNLHALHDETVQTGFLLNSPPQENVEDPYVNSHAWCNETVQAGVPLNSPPQETVEVSLLSTHACCNETVQTGVTLNSPPENVERSDVTLHALHDDTVQTEFLFNSPPHENDEDPMLSTHAWHNETARTEFLEYVSPKKSTDSNEKSSHSKAPLPESTVSTTVNSKPRLLSECKSPVELYMAAAPMFQKTDSQGMSPSTCKPKSLFNPLRLESIELKAEPGSVNALFPTLRRSHSRGGHFRWKLYNNRQILTSGDECTQGSSCSSPTALSHISSDSETTMSCCNFKCNPEDYYYRNAPSVPARSPDSLFPKSTFHPRSSNCRKRKLYKNSEGFCPAVDDEVMSNVTESLSETVVPPAAGRNNCELHHTNQRLHRTNSTCSGVAGSAETGEEVLTSDRVPVYRLYSETLTLVRKRSLQRQESVTSRASVDITNHVENSEKVPHDTVENSETAPTREQETTEVDITAAVGSNITRCVNETELDVSNENLEMQQVDRGTILDISTTESYSEIQRVNGETNLCINSENDHNARLIGSEMKLDTTVAKSRRTRRVSHEIKPDVSTENTRTQRVATGAKSCRNMCVGCGCGTKLDIAAAKSPNMQRVVGETKLDNIRNARSLRTRRVSETDLHGTTARSSKTWPEAKSDIAAVKSPKMRRVAGEAKLDISNARSFRTRRVSQTKLCCNTTKSSKTLLLIAETIPEVATVHSPKTRRSVVETKSGVITSATDSRTKSCRTNCVGFEAKPDIGIAKGPKTRSAGIETKPCVTTAKSRKARISIVDTKLDITSGKSPKKRRGVGETEQDIATSNNLKTEISGSEMKLDITTANSRKKRCAVRETKRDVTTAKNYRAQPQQRGVGDTKPDVTSTMSSNTPLVDGSNGQRASDQLQVKSDTVNAVRIQELLNASSSLSTEQQSALSKRPSDDRLRRITHSHFRCCNT